MVHIIRINEHREDKFKTNNIHNNQPLIFIFIINLPIQNHIPIHKIPNVYLTIINKFYRHIHVTTTKNNDLNRDNYHQIILMNIKKKNSKQITYTTINHIFLLSTYLFKIIF